MPPLLWGGIFFEIVFLNFELFTKTKLLMEQMKYNLTRLSVLRRITELRIK